MISERPRSPSGCCGGELEIDRVAELAFMGLVLHRNRRSAQRRSKRRIGLTRLHLAVLECRMRNKILGSGLG
jgi:hypothetical protein